MQEFSKRKKFEKAIPVLENIFVYTKFNNTLNPKTISRLLWFKISYLYYRDYVEMEIMIKLFL